MSRGQNYDTSIDELLVNKLDNLETLSAAEAREAVDQVAGLWFDKDNDLTSALLGDANANQILLRRNMVAQPTVIPWLVTDLHGLTFNIPDPVAGPGVDRTIQFEPVSPKPTATTLALPQSTSHGRRLTEAYALEIEVDTSVVTSSILPTGRRSITGADFDGCVQKVRSEVLSLFPNGDQPIDRGA
jgi:hypothetical protein